MFRSSWYFLTPLVFIYNYAALGGVLNIVTLGVTSRTGLSFLPYTGPAIDTAVEKLRIDLSEIYNVTHTYIKEQDCQSLEYNSDGKLAEWYYNSLKSRTDFDVILSPGCTETYGVNKLAGSWDIPLFTTTYNDELVRNKTLCPTWTTTGASSITAFTKAYQNVMAAFNWTSVFIVVDKNSIALYAVLASTLISAMKEQLGYYTFTVEYVQQRNFSVYSGMLQRFRSVSRVLFYFGHAGQLRQLMVQAALSNMTDGNFAYIAVEFLKNPAFGSLTWNYGDASDEIAKQAYRSLLVIQPYEDNSTEDSINLAKLRLDWVQRSYQDYNFTYSVNDQPLLMLLPAYATMELLGQVLKEIFQAAKVQPELLNRGSKFARLFWNRTFNTSVGFVYIDEAGQRQSDLAIAYFDRKSVTRQVFLVQSGKTKNFVALKEIEWVGDSGPPLNEPFCGYRGERPRCRTKGNSSDLYETVFGTLGAVVVALFVFLVYIKKRLTVDKSADAWWQFSLDEMAFPTGSAGYSLKASQLHQYNCYTDSPAKQLKNGVAFVSGKEVWVMLTDPSGFKTLYGSPKSDLMGLMKQLRLISHANVNKFVGILCSPINAAQINAIALMYEYAEKGSLDDLLDSSLLSDWQIVSSFVMDMLEAYLDPTNGKHKQFALGNGTRSQVYLPPEVFINHQKPGQSSDVYACGVIIHEILTNTTRVERILGVENFSLEIPVGFPEIVQDKVETVLKCSWENNPKDRPSILQMKTGVYKSFGMSITKTAKVPIMDKVSQRLEKYSADLERRIVERTADLVGERAKCDDLLRSILPQDVIRQLRAGYLVLAELFDMATLLFSDVPGFQLFTQSSPLLAVTDVLNLIECMLDEQLALFDVYKVEAVADTYIVASGLPVRNGSDHIKQISGLASAMQKAFKTVSLTNNLFLRIGIHSGECAAGVVGSRRPRYCLFGDSMNTASRMCSYGEPGKIHLSETSAKLLFLSPEFSVTERGIINIKGKAEMRTYWLQQNLL